MIVVVVVLFYVIIVIVIIIVAIAIVVIVVVLAHNVLFKNETKVTPLTIVTHAACVHHRASQIPKQQNIVNEVIHSNSHKHKAFYK